jgi:hypothetical protein
LFNAGNASLRLKVGMTEFEAISAIGWQPSSAEMATCGSYLGKPWQCKTLRFGVEIGNTLHVLFQQGQDGGAVIVNSWYVL